MPLRHYAALAYIAEQEGMAQQTLCEILMMDANDLCCCSTSWRTRGSCAGCATLPIAAATSSR